MRPGVRRMLYISLLVAAGLVLQGVEAVLPVPLVVPGARLGLANGPLLLALVLLGGRGAAQVGILRVLLGAMITGTLATPRFWLSAAGMVASLAVAVAAWGLLKRPLGLVGVSVLGAAAHNLGQLAAARVLTGHPAVWGYLPWLLLVAIPTGLAVGMLSAWTLRAVGPAAAARVSGVTAPPVQLSGMHVAGMRVAGMPMPLPAGQGGALLASLLVLAFGVGALGVQSGWAASAAAWFRGGVPGAAAGTTVAEVWVDGAVQSRLPLDRPQRLELQSPDGAVHMQVEVGGGRVRVLQSNCPDKICVKTGWIERPGQVIVCVPGRTVIQIAPRPRAGRLGAAAGPVLGPAPGSAAGPTTGPASEAAADGITG